MNFISKAFSAVVEYLAFSNLVKALFIVFAIATIGYLIGRISIKGIELGTAGVLLVALVFGHFGAYAAELQPYFKMVGNFGLILFVTSVGFIAGPKFFRNFKINFKSYVPLGIIIILSGALTCLAIIKLTNVPTDIVVGMMSGSLTSTPGLGAAQEIATTMGRVAEDATVGYGIAYPFGVVGVVLFVQLMPKLLKTDMAAERAQYEAVATAGEGKKKKLIDIDPFGFFQLSLAIVLGIILAYIKIPLPGGTQFSLGTSGGPLIVGILFGHFGNIGKINIRVSKGVLETLRELGLCLFLLNAGLGGGAGFVEKLVTYGFMLFVYGALMTIIPMIIGFVIAKYVFKLSMFNSLGSICGGMTSTPALGTLVRVAGTDDVASAYAATYPFALVCVVLACQFLGMYL